MIFSANDFKKKYMKEKNVEKKRGEGISKKTPCQYILKRIVFASKTCLGYFSIKKLLDMCKLFDITWEKVMDWNTGS